MTKIFLAGASGYIGGDFLHTLLANNNNTATTTTTTTTTTATENDETAENNEATTAAAAAGRRNTYEITALVRDSEAAEKIEKAAAAAASSSSVSVRVVRGCLEDAELVEKEVGGVDVVINVASVRNLTAAKNIHRGLKNSTTGRPVYWIQISGASVLAQSDLEADRYGESSDLVFHDDDDDEEVEGQQKDLGINALYDLIRGYPGREVENYVLDAGEEEEEEEEDRKGEPEPEQQQQQQQNPTNAAAATPTSPPPPSKKNKKNKNKKNIHTALLIAPTVHGVGRGPVKRRSLQIPELCRIALERNGKTFRVGKGQNRWGNVWIGDVSTLLVSLVVVASSSSSSSCSSSTTDQEKTTTTTTISQRRWGKKGIYLAGVGEMDFAELADMVSDEIVRQGYFPTTKKREGEGEDEKVEEMELKQADELSPGLGIYFGINARNKGRRARRLLGWEPKQQEEEKEEKGGEEEGRHTLRQSVAEVLAFEAELRGVEKKKKDEKVPEAVKLAQMKLEGKVKEETETETETKIPAAVDSERRKSRRRSVVVKTRSVVHVLRTRLGDMLFRKGGGEERSTGS